MKEHEVDIIDILIILAKHKKFIIITTLVVSIFAVVYSLVTPEYWTSTASLLPVESNVSGFSLPASLSGLSSSILGKTFGSEATNLVMIMKSRTFSEDVVHKFNLIEYFKIKESDSLTALDISISLLKEKLLSIQIHDETGAIYINVETTDKKLSADIANYYSKKIEEYNQNTKMTKGKQKRIFLENRITDIEKNIKSLSEQVNDFQIKHNAIDLTEQTVATLEMYSSLLSQKKQAEIKLEISKFHMSDSQPAIELIKQEINIINQKLRELEKDETESKVKYGMNLDDVSALFIEFSELEMKIKIEKALYEFTYPVFEQARLEEISDLPTIEIIDEAREAGLRSKPKRAQLCIIAFLVSILLTSIISIILENLKQENEKLNHLLLQIKK